MGSAELEDLAANLGGTPSSQGIAGDVVDDIWSPSSPGFLLRKPSLRLGTGTCLRCKIPNIHKNKQNGVCILPHPLLIWGFVFPCSFLLRYLGRLNYLRLIPLALSYSLCICVHICVCAVFF